MTRYNYIPNFSFKDMIFVKNENKFNKKDALVIFAGWDIQKKNITMYLKSFDWACNSMIGYPLYRKIINALSHEVIHGVTQNILQKDKWSGKFNPEWPMLNGMDNDYKRSMRLMNK